MIFNINLAVLKTEAIPIAKTRFSCFSFQTAQQRFVYHEIIQESTLASLSPPGYYGEAS